MAQKKGVMGADFIKEEIKQGLSGAYFFYGDEDYLKQFYLHEIEKAVVGETSSMNFIRLTNDEFTVGDFEDALNSATVFDFMSVMDEEKNGPDKLVELYEVDFKALKSADFDKTIKLLRENLDSDTVVVIYSTSAEMPEDSKSHQTIIRDISKVTKPACFPFESDLKLCKWLGQIAGKNKVVLEPDLARILIERVGHSMLVLKSELEKLISYVRSQDRNRAVLEDVKKVCVANMEISPFDFANALMRRDTAAAFSILSDMKRRGEEPVIILSTVSRVVGELIRVRGCMDEGLTRTEIAVKCSMHEYKAKLYMESLRNTDISKLFGIAESASKADILLKSSSIDSYIVLERLICELSGSR